MLVAKDAGCLPNKTHRAKSPPVMEHGDRKDGSVILSGQEVPEGVVRLHEDVRDLDGFARGCALARGSFPERELGVLDGTNVLLAGVPCGAEAKLPQSPRVLIDDPRIRLAERGGLLRDRRKHLP